VQKLSGQWVKCEPSFTGAAGAGDGAKGKEHSFRLDNIPEHRNGRPGHLKALLWVIDAQLDTVAATMSGAAPGELRYGLIDNITVESEGHQFVRQLDGLSLRRDCELRFGEHLEAITDIPDADETNAEFAFKVLWVPGMARGDGSVRRDGQIPLRLLNSRMNPANGVRFRIASSMPAFAGVTYDGWDNLTCYALVDYANDISLPLDHETRQISTKLGDYEFAPNGPIRYVMQEVRTVDSGDASHNLDGFTTYRASVGNEVLIDGRSPTDIVRGHHLSRFGAPTVNVDALSESAPQFLPVYAAQPGEWATRLPEGVVRIQHDIDTAYDAEGWKVTWRAEGKANPALNQRFLARLGALDSDGKLKPGVRVEVGTAKPGKGASAARILSLRVIGPTDVSRAT
jgi:hypothetical protein